MYMCIFVYVYICVYTYICHYVPQYNGYTIALHCNTISKLLSCIASTSTSIAARASTHPSITWPTAIHVFVRRNNQMKTRFIYIHIRYILRSTSGQPLGAC